MKHIILAVLMLVMLMYGCSAKEHRVEELSMSKASTSYHVEPDVIDVAKADLPIDSDKEDVIAIVTVPSYTLKSTPSGTVVVKVDTKVTLTEKHVGLRKKLFRKKDEPKYPIEATSNSSDVVVEQPEVTPWWQYVLWFVGFMGVAVVVFEKWKNVIMGPLEVIIKPLKAVCDFVNKITRRD